MKERKTEAYNPAAIEPEIYGLWEKEGAFRSVPDSGKQAYCIVIPPPNVTGALHIGHALNNSIQDVLSRFYRMRGRNTLWLPGTDHAGVATQSVVERRLWEEKKQTRYDIGREKLLEIIWEWKEKFGGRIIRQLKALGSSCDWERTRFTMDEGLSRAVRTVFVNLFHEGLVFRGKRLINWCGHHRTALSNDELVYKEAKGHFWNIRYPLADDPDAGITVGTTRPETMLGDTAVAVHPDDPRYAGMVGRHVILPLMNRKIPVITDPVLADPERGTGAVKVTPAHDPNDYDCGKRNNLPFVNILSEDGTLNDNAGVYQGLTILEAREKVVKDLEKQGLLAGVEDHDHQLAHCYRCGSVIEPFLSDQWFVKMQPLVELARAAGKQGEVRFYPESRLKQFFDWLDTTPDWCISRQIWWGHRIPVWYCTQCTEGMELDEFGDPKGVPESAAPIVPALEDPMADPETCPACGGKKLARDPDVLDTWFSSQLWPISTLGWPEKTDDLDYYYPTNVLVTARDIIALWVARMIMMGKKFIGKTPFHHVYIHGTILDDKGDIMSKSRGNGVDPLMLIQGGTDHVGGRVEHYKTYGADALRYGILSMATAGQDIRLVVNRKVIKDNEYDVDLPKMEEGRRFCNKIWQVTSGVIIPQCTGLDAPAERCTRVEDRWLRHVLSVGIEEITRHLENYEIGEACQQAYRLLWANFCSWYVEIVKPRLWGNVPGWTDELAQQSRSEAQTLLVDALSTLLRLLHPVMPFISEKLWVEVTALRKKAGMKDLGERIISAPWPDPGDFPRDEDAFHACETAMQVAAAINSAKSQNLAIKEKKLPRVFLEGEDKLVFDILKMEAGLSRFVGVEKFAKYSDIDDEGIEGSIVLPVGPVKAYLAVKGFIDFSEEKTRLKKQMQKLEAKLQGVAKKLENPKFISNAKPDIVEKERKKEKQLSDEIQTLNKEFKAWFKSR